MTTPPEFPVSVTYRFVEALALEIGQDTCTAVLSKAGLPREWARPSHFAALDGARAAQSYARLQAALRTYYGRGARGILIRIGSKLWRRLLDDAPLFLKGRAALIRLFPKPWRRKPALEILAGLLGARTGGITVHSHDLDLLLVDRSSPIMLEQAGGVPICFVTLGLLRECLLWADGGEYDIEERTCRAMGAHQCEFKITGGG